MILADSVSCNCDALDDRLRFAPKKSLDFDQVRSPFFACTTLHNAGAICLWLESVVATLIITADLCAATLSVDAGRCSSGLLLDFGSKFNLIVLN